MAPGQWNGKNFGGSHTGNGKKQKTGHYFNNGIYHRSQPHRVFEAGVRVVEKKTGNIGVKLEDLFVVIGFTSPTRFEYYNEELNQWKQMRHDVEDDWGFKPGDRDYDNQLLKNRFGSLQGMYSKWLSSVVSLHHILNSFNMGTNA